MLVEVGGCCTCLRVYVNRYEQLVLVASACLVWGICVYVVFTMRTLHVRSDHLYKCLTKEESLVECHQQMLSALLLFFIVPVLVLKHLASVRSAVTYRYFGCNVVLL